MLLACIDCWWLYVLLFIVEELSLGHPQLPTLLASQKTAVLLVSCKLYLKLHFFALTCVEHMLLYLHCSVGNRRKVYRSIRATPKMPPTFFVYCTRLVDLLFYLLYYIGHTALITSCFVCISYNLYFWSCKQQWNL